MNIWRLKVHHETPQLAMSWVRHEGRIAIGWGKIGDLRQLGFNTSSQIGLRIRQFYPELNNSGDGGTSLWNFYSEMKNGDLVILSGSTPRELVVEVIGNYEFANKAPSLYETTLNGDYLHQRRVQVTKWNSERLWQLGGAKAADGQNIRRTLIRCANPLERSVSQGAVKQQSETEKVPLISVEVEPVRALRPLAYAPIASQKRPTDIVTPIEQIGRNNKLTGQIGEFLVCAELGRRGFLATPFSGNVPAFDVLATDEFCRTVPIQVKASNHDNWPARAQDWMDIEVDEETGIQHLRGPKKINNELLIYVCVSIAKPGSGKADRFFILTKSDIQQACIKGYSEWMEQHNWKRPRNVKSFDCRYFISAIAEFEGNWDLIKKRMVETAPTTSLNILDE